MLNLMVECIVATNLNLFVIEVGTGIPNGAAILCTVIIILVTNGKAPDGTLHVL